MPEIGTILREGKGKKIYATDDPDKAIVFFKDEAMAFHGLKRGRILGKGEVNNSVCEHLFQLLKENGIENHYLERIDARRNTGLDADPLVNNSHIYAMKLATPEEMEEITRVSLKVNEILTAYLKDISIELIDFKLEFGRFHGKILVADEITPDTARFWDASTHEPLDIDRFRRDMDNVAEAYQEVLRRMMGVG